MKRFLFMSILLLTSLSYGGGSEVPWPISNEESVILDDITGVWMSKTEDNPMSIYYFYVVDQGPDVACPYVVGLDEVDMVTGSLLRRGSSNYCLKRPRKMSFTMWDEAGEISTILTFVGLKLDTNETIPHGSQYIGLTTYRSGTPQEREQDMLQKVGNFCFVGTAPVSFPAPTHLEYEPIKAIF